MGRSSYYVCGLRSLQSAIDALGEIPASGGHLEELHRVYTELLKAQQWLDADTRHAAVYAVSGAPSLH